MNRVFITKASVVCPIGVGLAEVMVSLDTGKTGLGRISCFNNEALPVNFAGEVKVNNQSVKLSHSVDRKEFFLRMALDQLLESEKATPAKQVEANKLLHIGMGLDYFNLPGYVGTSDAKEKEWLKYSRCSHAIATAFASEYKFGKGAIVNVSACVASSQAIGISYRMLKNSPAGSEIVAGGVDSMINPFHYMGFYKLGALSSWQGAPESACKPFDRDRCGLVLGEGTALFSMSSAVDADSKEVLAEIVGYGSSCDGYMVTDPDPSGKVLAQAALSAIAEAGLHPDEIDCAHLHGTGTLKNDMAEANAMSLIFGKRYTHIPVYSMKGQIGHLISACGAVEMTGVLYSIQKQRVPPTGNFTCPDPQVPLLVVKDKPLEMKIKNVLKLNSAFGGQNTALVVRKYEK